VTAPLKRVRGYEELDGPEGRQVFFRPQRYRASDLAPLTGSVLVRTDDAPLRFRLVDISQSGVAFECTPSAPFSNGDVLSELTVQLDEHVAYKGVARVGSLREQDGETIAGVSFEEQLIDVDELLQLRAIKSWTGRDGRGLCAQRPWAVAGSLEFKSMVADLALYLEDSQRQMADLESQLAWHVVQVDNEGAARHALIDRVRREFASEIVRQSEAIDAVLRSVPAEHRKSLHEFSLRQVDRFFMLSPWMLRARTKPFGYPGDYEVMRFFYERNFEGATLFAKAVGYSTIQTKAAQAVRCRKDFVKRQLGALLEAHAGSNRPVTILSVAAGPAQELYDLLTELDELPCPMEIVLFDQDKGALSYAFRRLKPLADEKFPGRVHLLYLHESIKRLLKDAEMFTPFGRFDFIFSCGLFDYLQTTTAVVLTRNLFARLAEGGALYIGNMQPANPSRWIMEHHLDWHLQYRTRPELLEVGGRAAPEATTIRILEEETGVNPFIQLVKG
jgi:extracellular factor (EF) 3-hydroxypalmitic acid methyl ester biosynthesis protein